MDFGSTLRAILRLARVALAAMLLVGVPLAEAATCGGEVASGGTEAAALIADVAIADDPANGAGHDQKPGDAQHCIHGHCHHATPFKTIDTSDVVRVVAEETSLPNEGGFVLLRVVTGLERPPKA